MGLKVMRKQIYQAILFCGSLAIILFWLGSANYVAGQAQNLLLNGDFEEGYSGQNGASSISVPTGWTAFWITQDLDIPNNPSGDQPEFMASDDPDSPFARANTGERSVLWHTKFSSAFAGVYQQVPVDPSATVRLSAWSYAWSSTGSDPELSQNEAWVRQRIGIDPTGGTDPTSEDIVWSQGFSQHIDVWGQLSVEATASSDQVTVFLSAYPNRVNPQNDIYYDTAELILVSAPLPTPRPIVGSSGVPGLAPTIDPLLLGLITGQGSAPGQQGIEVGGQDRFSYTTAATTEIPQPAFPPLMTIIVVGVTLLFSLMMLALAIKQIQAANGLQRLQTKKRR